MAKVAGPLLLTPGEPAGVGPELTLALAREPWPFPWVAVGDPGLLAERAEALGLDLRVEPVDPARLAEAPGSGAGRLSVLPIPLPRPVAPGRPHPANAPYVLGCLDAAVDACLAGRAAGLVTGPVHKGVINEGARPGDPPFTGHTEHLARRCGVDRVVMMLATEDLRVALATTHLPLAEVPRALSREGLEATLRILEAGLREGFRLPRPRILVCGLNPHAGEGGHLGREELEVIGPAVEALRAEGLALEGPLPADTAFVPARLAQADAVLAMYHDQGLPVLKHRGFGRAINVTLGLPLVRTSVDHGTALELAGRGLADPASLRLALETAARMAGLAAPAP
ncbi:MAG: 4-hydroxythreonine-4-phosphate dehydrogenase PdxA [Gammaproteobacteria bacterium]|nr:MAG: 4-hydroxythreonine-4-phosphate dehydrogenase PdxA [Gammaproteobacteria bacterium]